jgi:DNA polymerase III sliding clamp (beta) subunit (PCNA family)
VMGDTIRMRVIDGLKPSVIDTPDDPDFIYLLMPVRI